MSVESFCKHASPDSYLRNTRRAKLKVLRESMKPKPVYEIKRETKPWWEDKQIGVGQASAIKKKYFHAL